MRYSLNWKNKNMHADVTRDANDIVSISFGGGPEISLGKTAWSQLNKIINKVK